MEIDRRRIMDKEIINWLCEGPDWLRYAVELQLLDVKPDAGTALQDASIEKIVRRLKSRQVGIPALKKRKVSYAEMGNAYWDLFFLADIGLTASDMDLNREIEDFLTLQAAEGTFVTESDMNPNYFCISAIFLSSIARMGYEDGLRLRKYVDFILDSQRLDGGWHCAKTHAVGQELQDAESCPMDNLNILMLLGQYEEYRKDSRFNGALDLLLNHWKRKDEPWRLYGFGIGERFMSLSYPAAKYGIMRVLDVLSLFPYAVREDAFKDMLDFVHQKSSGGKYFAELATEFGGGFDFEQTDEPSRWITFLINRIEKRVSESD